MKLLRNTRPQSALTSRPVPIRAPILPDSAQRETKEAELSQVQQKLVETGAGKPKDPHYRPAIRPTRFDSADHETGSIGNCLKHFQVLNELGKGSYGQVFKVKSTIDGQVYVLKTIDVKAMKPEKRAEAFQEAKLLKKLKHANIIRYYTSFLTENDEQLAIVMEYAEKGDLHALVKKHREAKKILPERDIWNFAWDICRALEYLHGNGIMHRDIKTLNIFLDINKRVKVGDLGVSKLVPGDDSPMHKTRVGTPLYLAPEVIRHQAYDFKIDIWALGCVVYYLAALEPPFHGDNLINLGMSICNKLPKPIPGIYSAALSDFIKKLLEKTPSRRPSAKEALNLFPVHITQQYPEYAPLPLAVSTPVPVKLQQTPAREQKFQIISDDTNELEDEVEEHAEGDDLNPVETPENEPSKEVELSESPRPIMRGRTWTEAPTGPSDTVTSPKRKSRCASRSVTESQDKPLVRNSIKKPQLLFLLGNGTVVRASSETRGKGIRGASAFSAPREPSPANSKLGKVDTKEELQNSSPEKRVMITQHHDQHAWRTNSGHISGVSPQKIRMDSILTGRRLGKSGDSRLRQRIPEYFFDPIFREQTPGSISGYEFFNVLARKERYQPDCPTSNALLDQRIVKPPSVIEIIYNEEERPLQTQPVQKLPTPSSGQSPTHGRRPRLMSSKPRIRHDSIKLVEELVEHANSNLSLGESKRRPMSTNKVTLKDLLKV